MKAVSRSRKVMSEERRAERLAAQRAETRRRELAGAGLPYDPRLAAAHRDIVVSNAREASGKRASLADYASLIKRRQDRTEARIHAMRAFDGLCHAAYAGLYPEPRFERGVDTSRVSPGLPDARATALREIQRLSGRIGDEAHALCYWRIFERQTLAWMAEQGMGDAERLGVLFLSAVDAVAWYYGIGHRSRAASAMDRRLGAD